MRLRSHIEASGQQKKALWHELVCSESAGLTDRLWALAVCRGQTKQKLIEPLKTPPCSCKRRSSSSSRRTLQLEQCNPPTFRPTAQAKAWLKDGTICTRKTSNIRQGVWQQSARSKSTSTISAFAFEASGTGSYQTWAR